MDKKTTKRAKNAKQKGEISLQQQQQQQQHVSRFLEAPFDSHASACDRRA